MTARSLGQRSPTECGVSEYDLEISALWRPTGGCLVMENSVHTVQGPLRTYSTSPTAARLSL